jgi:hypothetical protein
VVKKKDMDKGLVSVQWLSRTTPTEQMFTPWREQATSKISPDTVLANLTQKHQSAYEEQDGDDILLTDSGIQLLAGLLEIEFTEHIPLPAVVNPPVSPLIPSPPASLPRTSNTILPLSIPSSLSHQPTPAPLDSSPITGQALYQLVSQCSDVKNIIAAAFAHSEFPFAKLVAAERNVLSRLSLWDTRQVLFVSRFAFTYNNESHVYVRGIESHGTVGTLSQMTEYMSPRPTLVESLVTHDLIRTLKPIESKTRNSFVLDLQSSRTGDLKAHASRAFDFAFVAVRLRSQQPELLVVAQSTSDFANMVSEALRAQVQSVFLPSTQPTRLSLSDLHTARTDSPTLKDQMFILNCLPSVLPKPEPTGHGPRSSVGQRSVRQSVRYSAVHGTEFHVALSLTRHRETGTMTEGGGRQKKRKRILDEELQLDYSFPNTVLPSTSPPDVPELRVEPCLTDSAQKFYLSFLKKGVVRCVSKSVDKVVFLWNGTVLFSPSTLGHFN